VIIQLEDAHWLDPDSEEFLGSLTRNIEDFPLILLVTSREELAADLFAPEAPHEVIHLQALGQKNLEDMAQAVLERQPSPALLHLLEDRTGGNPFYAEQMLLYLQENDLLDTIADQVDGVLPGDVHIPTDVRTLLTARLDRLPSMVKDVVQNAAVLGREFETSILFNMMAKDPTIESKLAMATEESIWIALDHGHYLFQHALLRDAAYDMQLHSRRRQLHKSAALAFEDQHEQDPDLPLHYPEIAYHFDKAEEKAQASLYYGKAGGQAKENYSNTEAISYFSRGLELSEDADYHSKYSFLSGRETICQWLGQRDEQQSDLRKLGELLDKHPDDSKYADLALRQSSYALVTGDYDTAVEMAQRSLEFAHKADDIVAEAKAYHRWGRTLWQQGRAKGAEEPIQKALDLVRAGGGNLEIEAMCHYDLNAVYLEQANFSLADVHLELANQAYESLGDKEGLARCQNGLGLLSYARADYSSAIAYYKQALELCRQIGWRYVEPRSLSNIGNTYFDLGNYRLAQTYHEQSLAICREINNPEIEAISLDTLGLIAHNLGHLQNAVTYYKDALNILRKIDNKSAMGYTLTHLGYVLADLGQYQAANSALNKALQIRRELGADALVIDTLAGLAQISLKQGQLAEAQSRVTQIIAWTETNGIEGIELPVLVYLICFQVMQATVEEDSSFSIDAQAILEAGHLLLEQHALRIRDSDLRLQFMENVPYNHALQAAWLESQ
jgi:predicted ATPase